MSSTKTAKQLDVHEAVADLIDRSWTAPGEPGSVRVPTDIWLALRDAHESQRGERRCPECGQKIAERQGERVPR